MDEKEINEKKIVELSIDDILPNRFQPRIKFEDSAIFELSESIKIHGVFQPIIVRPLGDKYEIIAGERRYKASVLAGKKTVPAIIMNLNDNDTVEIALIENVQRANLTPIEEAISYKKILDMGYINQEELAQKLGKSQSTIANKLRLLNLDEDVQEALLENKISERHARSLLKLKDYQDQRNMLEKILSQRLTVRKTDEEIDKMLNNDQNLNNMNNNSMPNNSILSSQPVQTGMPNYNFSDINNEVINPSSIDSGVITSTVISSNDNTKSFNPENASIMDVNNIEQTAKDFNAVKPVAPMSDFLVNNNPQPNVETPEENPQDNFRVGKFFTFPQEPEEKPAPVDYSAGKNFNFDNLYSNQFINIEKNQNNENPTGSSNLDSLSSPNPNSIFNQPFEQDKVNNIPTSNENPSQVENNNLAENPFLQANPNNFAQPSNDVMQINEVDNISSNPFMQASSVPKEPPVNDIISQNVTNNIGANPFTQENPISSMSPVNDALTANEVINPFIQANPVSSMPSVEQNNMVTNNLDIKEEPSNVGYTPFNVDTNMDIMPEMANPNPVNNASQKNIMSAVSAIRRAINEVRSLGYNIDSDEIDMDSLYQIIIKIEK